MKERIRTARIRQTIIDLVADNPRNLVREVSSRFSLSRQAVQNHVNALVEEGAIAAVGRTRARRYELRPITKLSSTLNVNGLEEHVPWRELIQPKLDGVPKNIADIAYYGFTEMLNNVIDHSGSDHVVIDLLHTPANLTIVVNDFGIGIFRKIMSEFKLADEVAAIWELSKGKLTTDPTRHSGEGVFFTSRMCDYFALLSGSLCFLHSQPDNDWLIEDREKPITGTYVKLSMSLRTTRSVEDVFNEFADPEKLDYSFAKTHVPVSLMQYGHDNLISRSQAKRVLQRFDRFREVLLDFSGVEFIGQGFADEVFRVYQRSNPDTTILTINANSKVKAMIEHVKNAQPPLSPPGT